MKFDLLLIAKGVDGPDGARVTASVDEDWWRSLTPDEACDRLYRPMHLTLMRHLTKRDGETLAGQAVLTDA